MQLTSSMGYMPNVCVRAQHILAPRIVRSILTGSNCVAIESSSLLPNQDNQLMFIRTVHERDKTIYEIAAALVATLVDGPSVPL